VADSMLDNENINTEDCGEAGKEAKNYKVL
jgi:hypothetical protein